jgi:hypothetical protein
LGSTLGGWDFGKLETQLSTSELATNSSIPTQSTNFLDLQQTIVNH